MTSIRDTVGTAPNGHPIYRIAIGSDRLRADILTFGSVLESVSLDGGPNMTAAPEDRLDRPQDFATTGSIIGPVVNRLVPPVSLDGRPLDLGPIRPEGTVNHSGKGAIQNRAWHIDQTTESSVTLTLDLTDGDGGFPGDRHISARWSVIGTDLTLELQATTDRPTLMNMAHHPYWALDGLGRGDQRVQSAASEYLPTTPDVLPTGEIADVTGTDYDFRQTRMPADGLDANLCLSRTESDSPRPAMTVTSPGGRRLDILTTAPGLQIFTGKPIGIALEPQLWPNAPAQSHFPSIRIDADTPFRQTTIYRFSSA